MGQRAITFKLPIFALMKIAILLATYNGKRYLRDQIESLYRQTLRGWTLYVADDGSDDGTAELLAEYARSKNNFVLLPAEGARLGAKDNFLRLLREVEADYFFFCDQDDVWCEDKMEVEMERMRSEERSEESGGTPIVVFSDLYVTDERMNVIAESFHNYAGICPQLLTTFNEAGGVNHVTGCTMLFNRAAKDCLQWPASDAAMHDAWVSLCVLKAGGRLAYVRQPLVYYRQHSSNTLGATKFRALTMGTRLKNMGATMQQLRERYRMLRALNYGPWIKFVYYRMLYKYKRWRLRVES